MKTILALAFFCMVLPLSQAAGPRFVCASQEIERVLKSKNLGGEVMYSGDIRSITMTQTGYIVTTDRCEVEALINYISSPDAQPCPQFEIEIKRKQCN